MISVPYFQPIGLKKVRISGDLLSNPLASFGRTHLRQMSKVSPPLLLNSSCTAMSGQWSILSGFFFLV